MKSNKNLTGKNSERIGSAQALAISLLLVAEEFNVDRLSVVQLVCWLPASATVETRRNTRVQYKRVLRRLIARGLVAEAGKVPSVTKQASGSLQDWIGKRVPAGYQRAVLAFSLTPAGRSRALELLNGKPTREQNFLVNVVKKALVTTQAFST